MAAETPTTDPQLFDYDAEIQRVERCRATLHEMRKRFREESVRAVIAEAVALLGAYADNLDADTEREA